MKKKIFLIVGLVILTLVSCIKKESPVHLDTSDTLGTSNVPDTSNTAQISSAYWPDGAIIDAASGSPSDIRAAIESANPGDNIRVPAGTFVFDESVNLEAGVNIVGAGLDATILRTDGILIHPIFIVDGSNGLPVGFANMKLLGGDQQAGSTVRDKGVLLRNGCQDFRVTEMEFENFGEYAISVYGNARGVIDSCRFINNYRDAIGGYGYSVCVMGDGDASWNRPFILGDQNAVFVEDCYFIGNNSGIASNYGSRYVFRYNLIEDNANTQAIDAHGPGFGSSRGSRSYEIYENIIDNANTTCWSAIFIRGGDGVVYNNTIVQGISYAPNTLALRNESPGLDEITELYMWENYYQGNLIDVVYNESPATLEEGQDYFINVQRPEYTPYTYPHPLRGEFGE